MQSLTLIWTLLFAIQSTIVPLELTLSRTPGGAALAASLHNVSSGVNAIRAHFEQANGSWTEEDVDQGSVFSVSDAVMLAGFAYLAAVCNFAVCIYRRDLSDPGGVWEGKQLSGISDVSAVTLALTATGLLGLTLQTLTNEWWFFTGAHTATLAALAFTSVQGYGGIFNPFDGGQRTSQAQSPSGESCHLARLVAVTQLAAICFIAGTWQSTFLESMAAPVAGDLNIESRALYHAGFYYFLYILASGGVHLARMNAVTLAVTTFVLGSVALLPGIVPGVAMQIVGDHLVAAWPGAAIAFTLLTGAIASLSGFPLSVAGPIALLGLSAATVLACGAGSIECTVGAPPVPAMGTGTLFALVAVLLTSGWLALNRRPLEPVALTRRRRRRLSDP